MHFAIRFGLAVSASACSFTSANEPWSQFVSRDGFAVAYPRSWSRVGIDNGIPDVSTRLNIISSPSQARGVVIARGQAEIIVMRFPTEATAGIGLEALDDEVVLHGNSDLLSEGRHPCDAPTQVVSRAEVGTNAHVINTRLVCDIGDQRFLTLLTHWENEARRDEFRAIALQVAGSITVAR